MLNYQQTGHTALDKAQDNNNRDLAILLAKSNQVSNVMTFKDFPFRISSLFIRQHYMNA